MAAFYSTDLAYIHEAGFGGYARRVAPELVRLLLCHQGGSSRHGQSRTPRRVVEFGCGAGTVVRELSRAGFDLRGIDISPAMLRMARARAPRATLRVGSWATAPIPRCTGIIAVGEIVSYLPKPNTKTHRHEENLKRFFSRAFAALEPGGLLIFDFIESPKGRTYRRKRMAGHDWTIDIQARMNRSGTMIVRRLTMTRRVRGRMRRTRETHRVRIYSREKMAGMLRKAGFKVTMRRSIGSARVFRSNVAAIAKKVVNL